MQCDSTIELRNLQDVARNYLSTGVRRLLLSGVVESRSERERYRQAIGIDLSVCRLRADLVELHRRLRARHGTADVELRWHLDRAGQLDEILDDSKVDDCEVSTDGRAVAAVAAEVLSRVRWT